MIAEVVIGLTAGSRRTVFSVRSSLRNCLRSGHWNQKMKIEIQTLWSPDLNPPSGGLPADLEDYDLFMQVSLGEAGKPGGEVFDFMVCSPSALARVESGSFVSHALVLQPFSWESVEIRLKKLLRHAESCADWECAIKKLAGLLRYSDE